MVFSTRISVTLLLTLTYVQGLSFGSGTNNNNKKSEKASTLQLSRNGFLRAVTIGSGSVLGLLFAGVDGANADVLQSKGCALGVGEGCDDIAGGNELIRKLQGQSAAKKEVYIKEALDAYNMKNYPDFFQTIGQVLVKMPDGGFNTFSEDEFSKLKAAGKITTEKPMAMGGKVADLTQKPIFVMRE